MQESKEYNISTDNCHTIESLLLLALLWSSDKIPVTTLLLYCSVTKSKLCLNPKITQISGLWKQVSWLSPQSGSHRRNQKLVCCLEGSENKLYQFT
jgi:hypothetical protein